MFRHVFEILMINALFQTYVPCMFSKWYLIKSTLFYFISTNYFNHSCNKAKFCSGCAANHWWAQTHFRRQQSKRFNRCLPCGNG